jgi:hypothetical protein
MTDLNKKNFYSEIIPLLEEIEEIYEDHDFDEEYDDGDDGTKYKKDDVKSFIEHIRDAKELAQENS